MLIKPLNQLAPAALEELLDAAFGTDRHGRTAYMVREGMAPIASLSIGWVEDDALLGSVQCWPVRLKPDQGADRDMIMVGPVAVRPDKQQQGIGKALMRRTMELHDVMPADERCPMMMIGDAPYYGEWGFTAQHTGGWRLPGPFERDRLLLRWPDGAALAVAGDIGPRN